MKNLRQLFTALLLLCSGIVTAQDIDIQFSGFEFQGIYYKFTGGNTVAVGDIYTDGDIEIPERPICDIDLLEGYYTVTSISDNAFENKTGVTSVKIPNTVTTIGRYAFNGCTNLTSIVIGSGVNIIDEWAFHNCTALESITIPDNVKQIKYAAFKNCSGLKEIIIEDSEDAIYISESESKGYPYAYCIPAFASCQLESVYLGRDIKYLGSWYHDEYGESHFSNHTTLKNVVYGNKVTSIRHRAFYYCSKLENITIPNSIESIGYEAFEGCTSLKEINIPNTVNQIGYRAFTGCTSLGKVNIPNTIKKIERNTFSNCTSLMNITIPCSVDTIEYGAFYTCSGLKEVIIENGTKEIYMYDSNDINRVALGTFNDSPLETVYLGRNIAYPLKDYKSFSPFSGYQPTLKNVTISNNVTILPDYLFLSCSGITNVTIPNSVKVIGKSTFENCIGLTSINIPNSVTTMIDGANFYGCKGLKSVTIGDGITNIPNYAFCNCTALESVEIGSNVKTIGDYTFKDCSTLTNITIPNSVTTIGIQAFSNCTSLESVTFGNAVTTIKKQAFQYCHTIKEITIPNSVKTIGEEAFRSCNSIKSVTVGNGVTCMERHAFYDCSQLEKVFINNLSAWCKIDFHTNESSPLLYAHNLYLNEELITNVVIPNDIDEIKAHTFQGCTSIKSVTIPEGITSIGVAAFEWCYELTGELVIPNSVTRIEGYAFKETNLTGIKLGSGLTFIGENTFYKSNLAGELVIPEGVETIGGSAFFWCYDLAGELVIPNSVKTIGGGAFQGCSFTSLRMGNKVETIGEYAFGDWGSNSKIKDVYITDLSAWCKINFSGYTSNPLNGGANLHLNGELLTKLVIPNDITEIKQFAFYNCKSINKIDLGNITSIGLYAFQNCNNLTDELVIPNSVTSIGYSAFYECSGLRKIVIGDGITELGSNTFMRCYNLDLTLGKNIERIDQNAFDKWQISSITFNSDTIKNWFSGWDRITKVYLGENVRAIASGALSKCNIDSIHIPAGLTLIGDYAFSWNKNLRKVTVAPENPIYKAVEEQNVIMETATNKVVLAARGATIPQNATIIGNGAFNGLLGINKLVIPATIDSIGEWAFDGCSDLKTVINYSNLFLKKGSSEHGYVAYYADEVTNITGIVEDFVFLTVDDKNYLIDYIGDATSLHLPNEFNGKSYIVADSAFKNKKEIASITMSDGVTEIANSAFADCEALEELYISATVEKIGKDITAGCNALTTIIVDDNNPTFDSREDCNAIISKTEYIASYNTELVVTTAPETGKTYIIECPLFNSVQGTRKALYNKNGSEVSWKTLDETDESFLWKVRATATGKVLQNVKDGRYLIGKAQNETNWTLQSSSKDCEFSIIPLEGNEVSISITGRHIHAADHDNGNGEEGRIVSWETNSSSSASAWTFFECKAVDVQGVANTLVLGCKKTIIPEDVVAIGDAAFNGVHELETVKIPASITTIGKMAFYNCDKLADIYIEATSPATIHSNTFSDYSANLFIPTNAKSAYQAADYWKNFLSMTAFEPTGIDEVTSESRKVKTVYDLQGRKVENPANGIYIIDGKKVLIK